MRCELHGRLADDGKCDVCEGRGLWEGIERPTYENKTMSSIMTPSQLKHFVEETGSYFFTRDSMKFFGDTMRNYGVRSKPVQVVTVSGDIVECWELYRRRPVKNGL